MIKLKKSILEELDQKISKQEQADFVNQAVFNALKKLKIQKKLNFKSGDDEKRMGFYSVYTDGGARGNPGIAGCGGVVFNEKDSQVSEFKHFIPYATNNEAEYTALLFGVKEVLTYNPQKVIFYLDSELVVKQMKGEYKIKKPELKEIYLKIQAILGKIHEVSFVHIPREKNKLADKLANEAMDKRG